MRHGAEVGEVCLSDIHSPELDYNWDGTGYNHCVLPERYLIPVISDWAVEPETFHPFGSDSEFDVLVRTLVFKVDIHGDFRIFGSPVKDHQRFVTLHFAFAWRG